MKTILFVFAAIIVYIQAKLINKKCDGLIVHNINHEKETLKSGIDSPYQLAMDYVSNVLFFSYSTNEKSKMFESAYIDLNTNEFGVVDGINGGFANAVDNEHNKVYLGGNDGIYEFDYKTKTAHYINGTYNNIWQMFFKNDLYYSNYPDEKVFIFKDGKTQQVPELIGTNGMLVAVDNDRNIYFSNSSGLFVYKKTKNNTYLLGDFNVNGFTADEFGNLFFSTPDGLYSINDKNKRIEPLVSIDNIYGVAVGKDASIIYASGDSIVRLKPTKTYCSANEK